MASIVREKVGKDGKVKYRYSNYDNEKLKKGETLIKSGISKEEAFKYVTGANKGETAALTAIANMEKATQEQTKAEEATKRTEATKKAKEAEIENARQQLSNAQLYGSDQDINAAQAYLNSLLGVENKPFVEPGQVQWTSSSNDKPTVKAAVEAYNSKDGTWNEFLKTLQDAGYNDDTIETIMTNNNISGPKAQEWLDERHGKKNKDLTAQGSLQAKGTPVTTKNLEEEKKKIEEKERIKEAAKDYVDENHDFNEAKKEMDAQKDAAAGKNIEDKTVDVGNTNTVAVDNQFDSGTDDDKQTEQSAKSQPEQPEAKDFWKKWRAGALRAYPMLQSIGDAISRNARMTADRAALLTGGQRDTGAYDPIEIKQMTPEQRAQLAFADAEAGNYDTLKQSIMSGEIDIDNAAQALNTTPESLQERFARSERSEEADVTSKEMSNEQVAQQIDQSNEAMINSINQQIAANNEAIRALRNPDESWDNYSKAARAVLDAVSGLQTAGSSYSDVNEKAAKADIKGGVPVISGELGGELSNAITNTTTGSTDVQGLAYLQTALDKGQKAYNATDKNNEKAAQQLEAWNEQLKKDRKYYESLRKPLRKLQGKTAFNYDPNSGTTTDTETPAKDETTNTETLTNEETTDAK